MTERIYYTDAYLTEFDATVLEHADGGRRAYLDRTAFYPTSGGQPFDRGRLAGAEVVEVMDEGERIAHLLATPITEVRVRGCIDWARRFDHMQQHTGQHLLSAVFQERFGLPTVSFHLGAEICTIDLRGPEPSEEFLEGAERASNQVIFEDRPVIVRYGTADELSELGVRKEVDREGILRAIEIESADLQP